MHRKDIFQWPVCYQPVSAANKWTLTFTPEDVSDGLPEVCTNFSEVFFNFLGFVGSTVDVSIKDKMLECWKILRAACNEDRYDIVILTLHQGKLKYYMDKNVFQNWKPFWYNKDL